MNSRLRVLEKTVKPAAAANPYMSASIEELDDLIIRMYHSTSEERYMVTFRAALERIARRENEPTT